MRNMSNPYMSRRAQQGQTGSGRVSEARVAKKLNARTIPNSGAVSGIKGDMLTKRQESGPTDSMDLAFRIEAKSTKAGSMSLAYGWLTKILQEATTNRQSPALTVSFTNDAGNARPYGDWVCIPLSLFNEMVGALKCKNGDD